MMVGGLSIMSMVFSLVLSAALPIGLVIYFYRKEKISLITVVAGAVIWVVFTQLLEKSLHLYVMQKTQIFSMPILLGIYGGLAAGIFEETGRFLAFKLILRNKREWKDGIAYGIGHGGIEAILLGGIGYIQYLIYGFMLNSGKLETLNSKLSPVTVSQIRNTLTDTPWYMFGVGGIERLAAICIHIGLSIIVLYGIKNRKNVYLLYAIIFHAVIDFPAGMYQGGGANIWVVELWALLAGIISIFIVVKSKQLFSRKGNVDYSDSVNG